MKKQDPPQSISLFPVIALLLANLVAVCIGLFMLVGLHRKVPDAPTKQATELVADRIGEIKLDRDKVKINLMKFDDAGKIQRVQKISLPVEEGFLNGFERIQTFIDKMVEEGILEKSE